MGHGVSAWDGHGLRSGIRDDGGIVANPQEVQAGAALVPRQLGAYLCQNSLALVTAAIALWKPADGCFTVLAGKT